MLQEHLFRITCARQRINGSPCEHRQRQSETCWKQMKSHGGVRMCVSLKASSHWFKPCCKSTHAHVWLHRTHTLTQHSHPSQSNSYTQMRENEMRRIVKTKSNHPCCQSVSRPIDPSPWPGALPSLIQPSAEAAAIYTLPLLQPWLLNIYLRRSFSQIHHLTPKIIFKGIVQV